VGIKQLSQDIRARSDMFEEVVRACKTLLYTPEGKEAKRYISSRLSNYNIDKYNIGYFPNDDNLHLLCSLVNKDILEQLRLTYPKRVQKRGYVEEINRGLFSEHNIVFPFVGEYGHIIALAGRTLLDDAGQKEKNIPKYKNTFFTKSLHLFGLYKAKRAIEQNGYAFVVEGQMDCISCHANGYHCTVGLTGSDLSRYQLYLLKKMTNKIYLLFDNDEAGRKAFDRVYKNYSKYIKIEKLKVPEGYKDVDQYLRESGECGVFNVC
jgi:DNA primase